MIRVRGAGERGRKPVRIFVGRLLHRPKRQPLRLINGEVRDTSARSIQLRFLKATGLTQGTFRQIQRARQAAQMLDRGLSILETVQQAGYSDQAHLTRSLRRFIGPTPAHIVRETISG